MNNKGIKGDKTALGCHPVTVASSDSLRSSTSSIFLCFSSQNLCVCVIYVLYNIYYNIIIMHAISHTHIHT